MDTKTTESPLVIPIVNGAKPLNQQDMITYSAEDMIEQHNSKDKLHGFQPGNSIGKAGRPKGSKNKLSTLFTDDLYHEWERRGNQAVQDLTSQELVRTCVAILPKDVLMLLGENEALTWVINATPRLSDAEWQDGITD